jgi:hypothetical protein
MVAVGILKKYTRGELRPLVAVKPINGKETGRLSPNVVIKQNSLALYRRRRPIFAAMKGL